MTVSEGSASALQSVEPALLSDVRSGEANLRHRRDIDGLRALAVVPVILSHSKFPVFSGGFVGVDVFFVISGFLISDIIVRDLLNGRFSIVNFYERRARRIVPALAVVMVVSLIAGVITMLPDDLENLSQSIIATLFFANNVLLTITSGYWDLNSDFKPLLHTWSLGVEEQFYVLYPLLVMIIMRYRSAWLWPALAMLLVASLLGSVVLTPMFPNGSFYLLHTRAWELLLGAMAAHALSRLPERPRNMDWLATLGLVMIVGAIVTFDERLAYPSYFALLPCLGAALILVFSHPTSFAGRVLGTPVFVGIGLISYSAYLWHQPLFAFARIVSIDPPSGLTMTILSVATFPLAYLTWRYVEQPFRDKRRISTRAIFTVTAISTAVLGSVAAYGFVTAGLPERVPGIGLNRTNHIAYNERNFAFKHDAFRTNKPHLLVVGSSTARDLINVMAESRRFGNYEIIYRDDLTICNADIANQEHGDLFARADAIIWAASYLLDQRCHSVRADEPPLRDKPFLVVGPKHFGYNLNAYIFTAAADRPHIRASLLAETGWANRAHRQLVLPEHYVDLLGMMSDRFGGVPVFDAQGRILSADRVHLTPAGARLFATFVFDSPAWKAVFDLSRSGRSTRTK